MTVAHEGLCGLTVHENADGFVNTDVMPCPNRLWLLLESNTCEPEYNTYYDVWHYQVNRASSKATRLFIMK